MLPEANTLSSDSALASVRSSRHFDALLDYEEIPADESATPGDASFPEERTWDAAWETWEKEHENHPKTPLDVVPDPKGHFVAITLANEVVLTLKCNENGRVTSVEYRYCDAKTKSFQYPSSIPGTPSENPSDPSKAPQLGDPPPGPLAAQDSRLPFVPWPGTQPTDYPGKSKHRSFSAALYSTICNPSYEARLREKTFLVNWINEPKRHQLFARIGRYLARHLDPESKKAFKDLFVCGILITMPTDIQTEPEKTADRVDAVADLIHEVVEEALPVEKDRQEAKVRALMKGVPADAPFQVQIGAFTDITHSLRVRMARQLEPVFRSHLQAHSLTTLDTKEAVVKFTNELTDAIFRLGLCVRWKDCPDAAYLAAHYHPKRTRFRISRTGSGGGQIGLISDWGKLSKEGLTYVELIGLQDAAAPDTPNSLRPAFKG